MRAHPNSRQTLRGLTDSRARAGARIGAFFDQAQRNIELMWLTGRLAPDFKTIADFRKDNGAAIRAVCARFDRMQDQLESTAYPTPWACDDRLSNTRSEPSRLGWAPPTS
jgi:hypothetical protein